MAQNESDLLRLLHSTEHSFVERKTVGDSKDWVKTVVAFANTLSNDQEGVLFIGATDTGEIQDSASNLDRLQMTFSEKMQSAYPSIYYTTQTIQENGRECLAVVVPGSPSKPHFAGQPFVRDGSRSVVPDSAKYESLLAARLAKTYELQRWVGRSITVRILSRQSGMAYVVNQSTHEAQVINANQFYLTVSFGNRTQSYPLNRFEISFDNVANRLEVEVEGLPQPF
ncbi:MAG: ATP-binding protein [Terracidiphilus sp.]